MRKGEETFKLSRGRTLKITETFCNSDDPDESLRQGLRNLARIIVKAYLRGELAYMPMQ